MTKAKLLELLCSKRAEWDAVIAQVPQERMTEPGAAGDWSVKDIVAHLTYHERWYADRMHEVLRGEAYKPAELDMMHWEQRNPIIYERYKDQPLEVVLSDSRQAFDRLIEGVQAHSEAFLTEPQTFEGAPGPVIIWQMLRGDVYEHYGQHIPSVTEWLAAQTTE